MTKTPVPKSKTAAPIAKNHYSSPQIISAKSPAISAMRYNYEELVRPWSVPNSPLTEPFPKGLVYKPHGSSFTLEEPQARWISLLRKDRLVGSERKWPRRESSGEYAKKMAGSKVPPKGYE